LPRRRIEFVKTVASRGRHSPNHAATRFVCFLLGVGVTADYRNHLDSFAMIAIEWHLELDACRLFGAVLPRNNSCCFPNYVQCCRNIFSVIAKD